MRTYIIKTAMLKEFIDIYDKEIRETHTKILGNQIGFFYTDIGNLNEVIHLYGYDSYKSLLLAYSDASHEYGPLKVKNVIEKSNNFKVAALALAAVKCPEFIIE